MTRTFASFTEFYPFYLSEHADRTCRRLHFAGSLLVIACAGLGLWTGNGWWFLVALIAGYGFAWAGHFFFEHNRPATFSYPLYSLMGDWAMFRDILMGKIRL